MIKEGRWLMRGWWLMCWLHRHGMPGRVLARTLRALLHWRYACHISPLSRPLGYVNMPHPLGIVIGSYVEIGEGATIYQNVTLGQKGGDRAYPVIGRGAVIYTGAVVIGKIHIGEGAQIGANAVALADVPAGRTAVGIPARLIGDGPDKQADV